MQQIDTVDFLIEKQNKSYLTSKNQLFSEYMKRIAEPHTQNILVSLTGWNCDSSTESLLRLFCPDSATRQQGGYFLRYNGTGIAINPGQNFFERLTEAGFHLWEIDAVIVTSEQEAASSGIELLYALNRELNSTLLSYEQEPHVIRYLLHPKAYSRIASLLRPQFRQERETVVRLDTFDGAEKLAIGEDILLFYTQSKHGDLQLCLKLHTLAIGYTTNLESDDAAFFMGCDLLIMSPENFLLENFLLENSLPANQLHALKLVCLAEFSAIEGDTRLEHAKKLSLQGKACLPLDRGCVIDLDTLGVNVSSTSSWHFIPYQETTVVRLRDFAKLLYLCKDQTL